MTKEEILERIIANEISGVEANRLLYDSFLLISWMEIIAVKTDHKFHLLIKPLIEAYKNNNPKARKGLELTDLLAMGAIEVVKDKVREDNIIPFPPWGIKMK